MRQICGEHVRVIEAPPEDLAPPSGYPGDDVPADPGPHRGTLKGPAQYGRGAQTTTHLELEHQLPSRTRVVISNQKPQRIRCAADWKILDVGIGFHVAGACVAQQVPRLAASEAQMLRNQVPRDLRQPHVVKLATRYDTIRAQHIGKESLWTRARVSGIA